MTRNLIWRIALALAGCFAAAYVGQELLGGELLGWVVGGAILSGTCAPLFKYLLALRAQKAAR